VCGGAALCCCVCRLQCTRGCGPQQIVWLLVVICVCLRGAVGGGGCTGGRHIDTPRQPPMTCSLTATTKLFIRTLQYFTTYIYILVPSVPPPAPSIFQSVDHKSTSQLDNVAHFNDADVSIHPSHYLVNERFLLWTVRV
jgi:hypothetical protein